MADGQKIGGLFYDIDGDESKLIEKLETVKNEAVKIEDILKNVKLNFGGEKQSSDIQKAQLAADKLAISRDKATKASMDAIKAEALADKAMQSSNNIKQQGLLIDQKRATESAKTSAVLKKNSQIELNILVQEEQAKRRAIMDEERLAGIRKRNSLIGVQGQKDLALAYGLTNKTMVNQANLLNQLSSAAGVYFSVYQAGSFVKELAMVSGEFEKQRLSLRAIIQDSQAADKIFNQIKDLAVYSPFNFKELTDYAKQLSAFSIPTNEIFTTMKNLADISAGLGVDMNRIILAYGQVRSASVLRGQELRQFTEAGIPLVDELAKKFNELTGEVTTAGDVFDKISRREVPFEMIKDIFSDMTSEGGRFYKMQEIQATSLAGKISNLRDAYDIMLDSIGSANSEMMKGVVDVLVNVMDNWEKYWKILKLIVVAYGSYKAAVIALSVAQGALNIASQISRFVHLTKVVTGATTANIAMGASWKAMSVAMAKNPVGLAAIAIATLVTAITALNKETRTTADIISGLNSSIDAFSSYIDKSGDSLTSMIDKYEMLTNKTDKTNKEQDQLLKITKNLANALPEAANAFDEYGSAIGVNLAEIKAFNAEQRKMLEDGLRVEVQNGEKRIAEIKKRQKVIRSVLEDGRTAFVSGGSFAPSSSYNYQVEGEERNKLLTEQKDLAVELLDLTKAQSIAQNVLNGSISESTSKADELAGFAKRINAEIDKLNIGEELKNKLRITDATKDFEDIRTVAIDTLDEIQKKVDQMRAASSLFKPSDLKDTEKTLEAYKQFVSILGGSDSKKGGTTKDSFTEQLKDQLDVIKKAKSEYEKLLKVMNASDAAAAITSHSAFSGVSVADLTDDGYLKFLEGQLRKIEGRNTEAAIETSKTWETEIASIKLDSILNKAKAELDKIENYLSTYKSEYSLYETLFESTGDKELSMKIVFGDVSDTIKTYRDALKEELDRTTDPGLADKLRKQITDIDWIDKENVVKDLTETLKEYQTVKDKKAAIDKKYQADLDRLESLGDSEDNAARIELLKENWKSALSEIESESLKLSPMYSKIFGDISSYGARSLDILVGKTKEVINSAERLSNGNYRLTMDGQDTEVTENTYASIISQLGKLEKEANKNPFRKLADAIKEYSKAEDELSKSSSLDKILSGFSEMSALASEVGSSVSDMFSALGNDSASEATDNAMAALNSVSNIGQGFAKGGIVGGIGAAVGEAANWIGKLAGNHDDKLNKAIQRSQAEVKKLAYEYKSLEEEVSRQLGAISESQFREMTRNQKKQISELESQMENELKKKKVNNDAVEDYKQQIDEAKKALSFLSEDTFDNQFGQNIKSWAEQISSSLVDAFQNGTSAAEAFKDSVGDIMRNMASEMIRLEVLEPAFESLRDKMFGKSGLFSDGDFSQSDYTTLAREMGNLKGSVEKAQEMWNFLSSAAESAGISLKEGVEQSTLSGGIQAVTEDTANILASYLNAVRGDVSVQRALMSTLVQLGQTNTQTFANMYAELIKIQLNTLRTADNTGRNVEIVSEIKNILKNVSTRGSGMSINV